MPTSLGIALILAALSPRVADDEKIEPPKRSEFVVIPLRVHVLTADDLPEVDCKLSDDDIRRIVGKVNGVWHAAGVHWGLEPIIREPAAKQDRFRAIRDGLSGKMPPLGAFKILIPEATRAKDGLNVYYIHKFSVNGVYMDDRTAFVQETASLRKVEGGIDEPLPRVTAHELGHALGLPHRQARTNLLASGTTGTSINAAEIANAREIARKTPGAMTMDDLSKAIDQEKDPVRAESLKRWRDEANSQPDPKGKS